MVAYQKMKINSLSVFFPAYNEEANIELTVKKAEAVLKKYPFKWEILIIDDGSKDKTPEIADRLAKKNPKIRAIHQPNGGYGSALKTGFKNARYDWVIYNDSDGQFDFSEISKFLDAADKADVIYGYRIKRNDHLVRLLNAKGWALALLIFFGLRLKDVDVGFKMVSRQVLKKIPPLISTRGGMINAELAIQAKRAGFHIAQVGVHHYPRKFGQATGANLRVIIQSFIDLFKLRLDI